MRTFLNVASFSRSFALSGLLLKIFRISPANIPLKCHTRKKLKKSEKTKNEQKREEILQVKEFQRQNFQSIFHHLFPSTSSSSLRDPTCKYETMNSGLDIELLNKLLQEGHFPAVVTAILSGGFVAEGRLCLCTTITSHHHSLM